MCSYSVFSFSLCVRVLFCLLVGCFCFLPSPPCNQMKSKVFTFFTIMELLVLFLDSENMLLISSKFLFVFTSTQVVRCTVTGNQIPL